MNKFPKNKK